MPTLKCTGPCRINVGFNSSVYRVDEVLGSCEAAPEVHIYEQWSPLFSSPVSNTVPTDYLYGGQGLAAITLDLVRMDYDVLLKMMAARRRNFPAIPTIQKRSGVDPRMSRGRLLHASKMSFQLSIEFTAVTRNSPNLSDFFEPGKSTDLSLISGYYFPSVFLNENWPEEIGVATHKVRLSLTGTPYQVMDAGGAFGVPKGDFMLYLNDREAVVPRANLFGI